MSTLLFAMLAMQAASDAPPPKQTMQQQFDAATAAAQDNRCEEAVKGFEAIEATAAARKSDVVRAAVAVRKGRCLARLDRGEEAEASIRAGLPKLATLGESFNADVIDANMTLGHLAMIRLDYVSAAEAFQAALALSTGDGRASPLLYLARVTAFDPGPKALAYADEALSLMPPASKENKEDIASVRTVRARILMNQGRHQEAYEELRQALQLQGGLSLKVTLSDIITRADLAQAALLVGRKDDARKYLAYTGAGRTETPFATATFMDPPACGASGLSRDDIGVVDFSLRDDGSVFSVTPVYAPSGREKALEFARAVSRWSWTPAAAQAIKPFYRMAIRVELHCSASADRPALDGGLRQAFRDWIGPSASQWAPDVSDARLVPLAEAAIARAEAGGDERAGIDARQWLSESPLIPAKNRAAYAATALAAASRLGAPVAARAFLAQLGQVLPNEKGWSDGSLRDHYRRLLANREFSDDPVVGATLRLLVARPGYLTTAPSDAELLIGQVLGDSRLPASHPLKVNALLQRATLEAARKDFAAARASFDATGLSEEQCALFGVQPAMRSSGASSGDFPMAAMHWGFEGWVKTEFDIAADGRTIAPRAIIAYPPFVFNDAAVGVIKDARFEASYRPDGGAACSGATKRITFGIPDAAKGK